VRLVIRPSSFHSSRPICARLGTLKRKYRPFCAIDDPMPSLRNCVAVSSVSVAIFRSCSARFLTLPAKTAEGALPVPKLTRTADSKATIQKLNAEKFSMEKVSRRLLKTSKRTPISWQQKKSAAVEREVDHAQQSASQDKTTELLISIFNMVGNTSMLILSLGLL
jgi:hypothetical protein